MPLRFRLRSLFFLVVTAALLSELMQFVNGSRESPIVEGFGYFAYGGIAGLSLYTAGVLLTMLASQSPTGQRIGVIAVAVSSTLTWLLIVVVATRLWIPVCVIYSALVVVLMVILTKGDLATDADISPEQTIQRLRRAKNEALTHVEQRRHDGH